MTLAQGLYELLVSNRISQEVDRHGENARVHDLADGAADLVADHLVRQMAGILEELGSGEDDGRGLMQLEIANRLLLGLREFLIEKSSPSATGADGRLAAQVDLLAEPLRVLQAISPEQPGPTPPRTGLALPWLFTAGKGSPSLLGEVLKELASADQVDILVSFITVSGVRKLREVLKRITAPGADGRGKTTIRILTTTYTGATQASALDELARLPGCEVRVSLDGRRTRLHAKAWIFRRHSGFGSVYVGSANLSGAALTGGLEWTVKLAEHGQRDLFEMAGAHFETLWQDSEFQPYDPDNPKHRSALLTALGREAGTGNSGSDVLVGFFDLEPRTYQQEMLEELALERERGRCRNLLVAATGTGKTVVAAFDYRRICREVGGRPRLLFVAHREEILRQALRTFREVLRDPEFGALLAGGAQPGDHAHLFATIDSVTSRRLVEQFGASYWHTVMVDECHRLAAQCLDSFARAVRPSIFLGLTATPERSDGQLITQYFDMRPDGSPAVELRLWHALELQLLAPFEYYGCDDATDFREVPWDQAGERAAIDKLVTGNTVRARLVINEWRRLTDDPRRSRALVFCVSVAHARFMTEAFNRAGLPSACVVGTTPPEERQRAPQRLASGELCALVTVDLYNEGVDLPTVDTLLLLRPTNSPVLFQQQIGRGLRLAPDKESCLVLDFVGVHRTDFRLDRLLSSLTGLSRRELLQSVDEGFGSLPPGCHIQLQRQTREQVLQSLRALSTQAWRRLTSELRTYVAVQGRSSVSLAGFLHDQQLELEDVYRAATGSGRSGWTALRRDAGLIAAEAGPEEAYFSRRFADLLHVDDLQRPGTMAEVAAAGGELPPRVDPTIVQMLAYQVDGANDRVGSPGQFVARLGAQPVILDELGQLAALLEARSTVRSRPVPGLEDTALCLHASYQVREILTAVGWLTAERRTPFRAGTLPLKDRSMELLFVTLDKSEGFHERIAYQDHAISPQSFHWQTQNSAGPDTAAGRRYLESATNGWQFQLFVRVRRQAPYRACGPVHLESAHGDRPMTITWRLAVPLPIRLFREFSVLRGV